MLRLSAAFFLFVSSTTTLTAQAPALPPMLSAGIELCFRNGHSNEQYREKLARLGAIPVPQEKRRLSTPPNSEEEWSLTVNGTAYLTSFKWARTFCGVFGPVDGEATVAAVKGPLKFKYEGAGMVDQEIYRGQFDGEAATIMVSSTYPGGDVFLVFALDNMWDVFPGGRKSK